MKVIRLFNNLLKTIETTRVKGICIQALCELDIVESMHTMCEFLFNILIWTKTSFGFKHMP
jgi:hypothetical protein